MDSLGALPHHPHRGGQAAGRQAVTGLHLVYFCLTDREVYEQHGHTQRSAVARGLCRFRRTHLQHSSAGRSHLLSLPRCSSCTCRNSITAQPCSFTLAEVASQPEFLVTSVLPNRSLSSQVMDQGCVAATISSRCTAGQRACTGQPAE